MAGMMRPRIWWGILWGLVATVAMTTTHVVIWAVTGRLSVHALATKALPSIIVTRLLGPLPISLHLFLAVLAHLGYGCFWAALLFALTPRVTVWKGLGLAAFLYLGAHVFLTPIMGLGGILASGSPDRAFVLLFSVATHATYGITLGLLGWMGDRRASRLAGFDAALPERQESAVRP